MFSLTDTYDVLRLDSAISNKLFKCCLTDTYDVLRHYSFIIIRCTDNSLTDTYDVLRLFVNIRNFFKR